MEEVPVVVGLNSPVRMREVGRDLEGESGAVDWLWARRRAMVGSLRLRS